MVKVSIPEWEMPVHRFLGGKAELLESSPDGKAFTIWEALAYFKDEDYPLIIEGKEYSKELLIFYACDIFSKEPELAKSYLPGFKKWDVIEKLCKGMHD